MCVLAYLNPRTSGKVVGDNKAGTKRKAPSATENGESSDPPWFTEFTRNSKQQPNAKNDLIWEVDRQKNPGGQRTLLLLRCLY